MPRQLKQVPIGRVEDWDPTFYPGLSDEDVWPSSDEEEETNKKKTKKKLFRFPQHELDMLLAHKPQPFLFEGYKVDPLLAEQMPDIAENFTEIVARSCDVVKQMHALIRAVQRRMRREHKANGYVVYEAEVTDDEDDEDAAATVAASRGPPRGGRRRHRPLVIRISNLLQSESVTSCSQNQ